MGGCCSQFSKSTSVIDPPPFSHHSAWNQVLSPLNATGILADGILSNSVSNTTVSPHETYDGHPQFTSGCKIEVSLGTPNSEFGEVTDAGSILAIKVGSEKIAESIVELETSKENSGGNLKNIDICGVEHVFPLLEDDADICPICLEEYDAENPKKNTKCDHHFHLACLLEWMERSDTCAMCEQEMVVISDV